MTLRALSRRSLLATAAPLFTGTVVGRNKRAQAASSGNLIIFYTPNGFARSHFGAEGVRTALQLKPSLLPLQPFKHKVNVITGLCNRATDVHTGASQLCRLLTCSSGLDATAAYSASLDQQLATHFGRPALNLAAVGTPAAPWQEQLSWADAHRPAVNVWDPLAAWEATFGTPLPWQSEPAEKELLVLEYLQNETLRTKPLRDLPMKEQERVGFHRQAWMNLRTTWENRRSDCKPPELTQKDLAALPRTLTPESLLQHGRAKMDLMVAALSCQTRRVCTLLWQPAGPQSLNPVTGARNHFDLSQAQDAAALQARRQIDTWYATQFAYLLGKLDGHNLLDHTIVVWCSEVAEGQHHNNMTFVTAGGAALGLAQAQTVALPFSGAERDGRATAQLPSNRRVADLWLTLMKRFGHPGASYGDPDPGGRVIDELVAT